MCKDHDCFESRREFKEKMQALRGVAKALHCPPRWEIIDIIGRGEVKTKDIHSKMRERGYPLSKPGLYYHLSELKDAGIIEVSGYLDEGRGAPEKKWSLSREKIEIDLVNSVR